MPGLAAGVRGPRRLDHVLFGVSQVLLLMVAAWWFVFLTQASRREAHLMEQVLAAEGEVAAQRLAIAGGVEPGPLARDARFRVVALKSAPSAAAIPGTALGVAPTIETLRAQAELHARRRVMVFGEGALLLVLVGVCFGMLARLVVAERRYRRDVESFFARMTHEMKTPLAGLKALLQTLREGRFPEERRREVAEMGLRQVEREEHLIENLLTAQRLGLGAPSAPGAAVALAPLLASFVEHRERSHGFGRELIHLECDEALVAQARPGALHTILDNLADNAFKYGATRLDISAGPLPQGVGIVVRDDGSGFEPGKAEALFSTWTRGASTTGAHGTGLGLSISRSLAREMQGELVAESGGPGTGATFTLTLPCREIAT